MIAFACNVLAAKESNIFTFLTLRFKCVFRKTKDINFILSFLNRKTSLRKKAKSNQSFHFEPLNNLNNNNIWGIKYEKFPGGKMRFCPRNFANFAEIERKIREICPTLKKFAGKKLEIFIWAGQKNSLQFFQIIYLTKLWRW